jgi:hypothetical protein
MLNVVKNNNVVSALVIAADTGRARASVQAMWLRLVQYERIARAGGNAQNL